MASAERYTRAPPCPTSSNRRRTLSSSGSATAPILTPGSAACIERTIAVARCPSPITASLVTPLLPDQIPPCTRHIPSAYPTPEERERGLYPSHIISGLL